MNKIIEEQLKFILSSCKIYVTLSRNMIDKEYHNELDDYGFLASVGSNIGKIKVELEKTNKIIKYLEYCKKHPRALNYASFEQWITDALENPRVIDDCDEE